MKNILLILTIIFLTIFTVFKINAQENNMDDIQKSTKEYSQKILVVCYSFSNGNTRKIAKQLQQELNADYVEIEPVTPYPAYGGYNSTVVSQGQKEVESGYKPEIKPLGVSISDYDVIAIGTPTWWFAPAPPVMTFLTSNNFKGKKIIPFMTHGGWPGHVIKDIKENCKGAEFLSETEVQFDSQGGAKMITPQTEITKWIEQVKKELK